jgi:hypothetical protein
MSDEGEPAVPQATPQPNSIQSELEPWEIPSARGNAKGRPGGATNSPDLFIEIVRPLTSDDLPALLSPTSLGTTPIQLQRLRTSHHQLAQLLAQGRTEAEASLITGYSNSRISILKSDPTFAELLASYTAMRTEIFSDTLERMKVLGLSSLDELQERLESDPSKWTNRELMEMADMLLVRPRIATPMGQGGVLNAGGPNASATGITLQVQFVQSTTPKLTLDSSALPTHNVTVER